MITLSGGCKFNMKLFLVVLLTVGALGTQPRLYTGRIVGGSDAPEGAYPFIVKLQDSFGQFCAGAIIDEFTVVTAAHCLIGVSHDELVIVAGTNQINSGGDEYNVSDTRRHEKFTHVEYGDDIAILKIVGPIRYSDRIKPIELPTEYLEDDAICRAIGWGSLSSGGDVPINLQEISLKTVSIETCKEVFSASTYWVITDKNICTFTKIGEGMCHGDSGGSLTCDNKLAGILSGGAPCARGYPDVFTRVSSYLDWINDNRI